MSFRPGPLKAAAALAAGFIAVRVVYRLLFHGADGAGPVLLALPTVRLPPPFGHVVMFGPATLGGVWDAALSAIPIAATILAFGLLNALFDVSRLFARASRRGPVRGIARALSVAWATLPSLADAVRAARFAQRLRGERGGARLLSPVLERTLERATAVAAALELRGFAGRPAGGACETPVVLRDAAFGHAGGVAVRVAALELAPGTLAVLAGPTGSGKSTLLRGLAGLHSHVDGGTLAGDVRVVGHDRAAVPPRDTAQTIGVVLQHPRDAFATDHVADEIGLALELRGVAAVIRDARVREVAERIGIPHLLGRRLRGLSAGEATLVAIAAAIVEHPILLLVDEPLADLDIAYRARIVGLLAALAHEAGVCVVVAEHRTAELDAVADVLLRIDGGVLSGLCSPAPKCESGAPAPAERRGRTQLGTPAAPPSTETLLDVRGLTVRHGEAVAVTDASLALAAGEVVALAGPNGAGKSTLLRALAVPGRERRGRQAPASVTSSGAVALVPDASDDLFVCDTVGAECRRAERRAHRPGATTTRFAGFLGLETDDPAFATRSTRHPRDLSIGERRLLAIALQTVAQPRVLLVDEPTRGLDPAAAELVAQALSAHAAEGGAVLLATHDADFVSAIADRVLPMRDGCLGEPHLSAATRVMPGEQPSPPMQEESLSDAGPPEDRGARSTPTVPPDMPPASTGTPGSSAQESAPRTHGSLRSTGRLMSPEPRIALSLPRRLVVPALVVANLAAVAAFCWPLVASALPSQAHAAVPFVALALAPLAALVVLALLDGTVRSAHSLALLGTLAAIGAAIRIVGTGVGGVEALFVLLILAGRAFGARFGLLLGALSITLSAVVAGGLGPWTPFQMFACAWVGAGAGLLPRRVRGWAEIGMLCAYGILSSYAFGLVMNMWFWPFAVGFGIGISYQPGGSIGENLASFLVYSLVTSTLTWDTLRAVTTVVGLVLVGRAVLSALRRAKPVAPPASRTPHEPSPETPLAANLA